MQRRVVKRSPGRRLPSGREVSPTLEIGDCYETPGEWLSSSKLGFQVRSQPFGKDPTAEEHPYKELYLEAVRLDPAGNGAKEIVRIDGFGVASHSTNRTKNEGVGRLPSDTMAAEAGRYLVLGPGQALSLQDMYSNTERVWRIERMVAVRGNSYVDLEALGASSLSQVATPDLGFAGDEAAVQSELHRDRHNKLVIDPIKEQFSGRLPVPRASLGRGSSLSLERGIK